MRSETVNIVDFIENNKRKDITDSRYRQKSIILTSNRAMNDWVSIFPDPVMANAFMDRLAHNAHQIIIKGESFRKKYRPKLENA